MKVILLLLTIFSTIAFAQNKVFIGGNVGYGKLSPKSSIDVIESIFGISTDQLPNQNTTPIKNHTDPSFAYGGQIGLMTEAVRLGLSLDMTNSKKEKSSDIVMYQANSYGTFIDLIINISQYANPYFGLDISYIINQEKNGNDTKEIYGIGFGPRAGVLINITDFLALEGYYKYIITNASRASDNTGPSAKLDLAIDSIQKYGAALNFSFDY